MDKKYMLDFLKDLLNTPSPTGDTEKAIQFMEEKFKSINVPTKRTNKNALIATIEGEEKEAITFSGHVDTLGLMVKSIKDNGRLTFALLGSYAPTTIECENVQVSTIDGNIIDGTVLYNETSVHVYDNVNATERTLKNMEIRLDAPVNSKEDVEKLGIRVGDFIYLDPRVRIFENGYVKSRHLDDKACIASMFMLAKYLKEENIKPKNTIHFFISNYEEVGHGSSAHLPEGTTEFFAVDMAAPGVGQSSDEHKVTICAADSTGPYDYPLRKKLYQIAMDKDIPAEFDLYPHYGSDGSAALRAGWDIRVALIGPGVDASHAYERTHVDGIESTYRLMLEYVLQK